MQKGDVMNKNVIWSFVVMICCVMVLAVACSSKNADDTSKTDAYDLSDGKTSSDNTQESTVDESVESADVDDQNNTASVTDTMKKNRVAVFNTTNGEFTVELFEDKAPITTKNFIDLVEKEFYNDIIFHRVIEGFMIQTGDPKGDGTGGPGYTIKDEFHSSLRHNVPGMLSMANRGPDTGGSQFFITVAATPWLDNTHAIFGKVVDGMDVVMEISQVDTSSGDRPITSIIIKSITIKEQE